MDGIIIIDKPAGWTSHDVVARVRRILREKRVGHTGTLDPFATGVLVALIGRATRLAQFLSGAEKEYEATVRLGYATDTGDLTGARREDATGARREDAPGATDCTALARAQIKEALASLRGDIEQVPPMYSAKKVAGKKLYELARRGKEVKRKAVRIRISEFAVIPADDGTFFSRNEDGTCDVRTRVVCSAGTYVRVLAESVGARLGTGAHLSALRRTRAGEFRIERAFALEELEKQFEAGAAGELLVPLETALPHLPSVHLKNDEARRVRHGAAIHAEAHPGWDDGAHVQMLDDGGALLAVGVYDAARGLLHPRVMLAVEK